jgi:hypothetical protein
MHLNSFISKDRKLTKSRIHTLKPRFARQLEGRVPYTIRWSKGRGATENIYMGGNTLFHLTFLHTAFLFIIDIMAACGQLAVKEESTAAVASGVATGMDAARPPH